MVNPLGKFPPNIAELSKPLRELLSKKEPLLWIPAQDKAFTNPKKELTTPNILTLYDQKFNVNTIISGYTSSHAVLQKVQNKCHLVAYALHSMTCREDHYIRNVS